MNVHLAVFGAARRGRDALARIEQPGLVEGTLDRKERGTFFGRELHAHRIDLFDAHAVLAGDRTAQFDAQLEYFCTEQFGPLPLRLVVGIEQDQRMQIAVAGMKDVHAAQIVLALHLDDGGQHPAQVLARNGAVHAVVVGRDAPGRREGILAARPEAQALGLRLRNADRGGAGASQHLIDATDFFLDFFGRAIGLGQ